MQTKELAIVRRISQIIAKTTDYQEGLRLTVECIAEYLRVDACSVLVYDETVEKLVLEATYGLEQEVVHEIQLDVEEGITGLCFRTGEAVNTGNPREHPHYREFSSYRAHEYQALLAVPLMVGGRVIGVLDIAARTGRKFPARVVAMAEAISSPLAMFIMNARLAQEVGQQRKRKRRKLTSLVLKGKAVTNGVVSGYAEFMSGAEILDTFALEYAPDPEAERALFQDALEVAKKETRQIQKEASSILAEADAAIFFVHLMLLEDPTLTQRVLGALDKGFKLPFALKVVTEEFGEELQLLDNEFMRERFADMKDVILRIYQAAVRLEGRRGKGRQQKTAPGARAPIIVARELLPSQLMRVSLAQLAGIICEEGGSTTHVAILAKALQIPMLVGLAGATRQIRPNDALILDCTTGSCYVRPAAAVTRRFRPAIAHFKRRDAKKSPPAPALAATADGETVRLGGNISLISELPLLKQYGAMGVGLYRTEFMFMIRGTYPSEEEQYSVFKQVVAAGGDFSVTVRALDVGGDKPLAYVDFGQEDNPFLGWRGLRFLLSNPAYFEPHLRAILRTTRHGRVNILLPMVADLDELLQAKAALERARRALDKAGVEYDRGYHLGVMLEVPSALWALPQMLPHIDFVSIGTNDLTQYAFAVDRGNSRVTRWFRQFHPVVLRMIKQTCEIVGTAAGKQVSLCGEIAGKALGVPLLVGLGVRYLSMNPWRIPEVRAALGKVTAADCTKLAEDALACELDADIVELMSAFAKEHNLRG